MRQCTVCGRPFVFSERGWRSVPRGQVEAMPELVGRALAARGKGGDPAAFLAELDAATDGADWLLCARCGSGLDQPAPDSPAEPPVPVVAVAAEPPVEPPADDDAPRRKRKRPIDRAAASEARSRGEDRPPREIASLPGRPAWVVLAAAGAAVLAVGVTAGLLAGGLLATLCLVAGIGLGGGLLAVGLVAQAEDRDASPVGVSFLKAVLGFAVPAAAAACAYPVPKLAGMLLVVAVAAGGWFLSVGITVLNEERRLRWAKADLEKALLRSPRQLPADEQDDG
ncbi:MAG: hypothetical protein U0736_04335 [Gemmataceae bacterium]